MSENERVKERNSELEKDMKLKERKDSEIEQDKKIKECDKE